MDTFHEMIDTSLANLAFVNNPKYKGAPGLGYLKKRIRYTRKFAQNNAPPKVMLFLLARLNEEIARFSDLVTEHYAAV